MLCDWLGVTQVTGETEKPLWLNRGVFFSLSLFSPHSPWEFSCSQMYSKQANNLFNLTNLWISLSHALTFFFGLIFLTSVSLGGGVFQRAGPELMQEVISYTICLLYKFSSFLSRNSAVSNFNNSKVSTVKSVKMLRNSLIIQA